MKIAFVHDWLNGMRGGEKCLETLLDLFPRSPVYTLLCEPEQISAKIKESEIHVSWIVKLPFWRKKYRFFLPIFPWAIRSLKIESCDCVISISHCAAKSAVIPHKTLHVCYCLTPTRYLWGFYDEYFSKGPYHWLKYLGLNFFLSFLRRWDLKSSKKVDYFIAISKHVAQRIKKIYQRDAVVIYPPVDTVKYFYTMNDKKKDFFLIVSALVPYKKIDLAIEAFNCLGYSLKIIGAGTELTRLKKIAKKNIEFTGWLSDEALRKNYAEAKALVFPGEEDFGISPLEAQACGTPVIAYKKGGVLETVIEGQTGLLFEEQTKESLIQAIEKMDSFNYDRQRLRENAQNFSQDVFKRSFIQFLSEKGVG